MSDDPGAAAAAPPSAEAYLAEQEQARVDGSRAAIATRRAVIRRRLDGIKAEAEKGRNGDVRVLAGAVVTLVDLLGELLSDPHAA